MTSKTSTELGTTTATASKRSAAAKKAAATRAANRAAAVVEAVAAVRDDMAQDNASDAAPYVTEEGASMYGVSVEELRAAVDAERAQNAWDAQEEQERENVAQRSRQKRFREVAAECQWFGCETRATTTRFLVGQVWHVCAVHA